MNSLLFLAILVLGQSTPTRLDYGKLVVKGDKTNPHGSAWYLETFRWDVPKEGTKLIKVKEKFNLAIPFNRTTLKVNAEIFKAANSLINKDVKVTSSNKIEDLDDGLKVLYVQKIEPNIIETRTDTGIISNEKDNPKGWWLQTKTKKYLLGMPADPATGVLDPTSLKTAQALLGKEAKVTSRAGTLGFGNIQSLLVIKIEQPD